MTERTGTPNDPASHDEALKHARDQLHLALDYDAEGDQEAWLRRVQVAVRGLGDQLVDHQRQAESEGGTLPEATSEKPSLLTETRRLEREHTEMLLRAREIEQEIERELAFDDFKVELVRLEATVLHDIFHLHLLRADWLVYDAYYQVEGGESG